MKFRFKTGEKNKKNEDIEKFYVGNAYYSNTMRSIYCAFRSEEIGEISYMLLHYDFLAYQQLECRLAVAITVSSGIRRLPTMHRFLLTREQLDENQLYFLSGQLKLNNSEILITENAFRGFLMDEKLPKTFFQYFGDEGSGFIHSIASVNYYSFNESLISDSFLPPIDKTKVICLLRKYSSAQRYNKISDKAEEIVYKFLKHQDKEKPSEDTNNTSH